MVYCSNPKCKKVILDGDRCYQVRNGHWFEHDAQDPGEFKAEENIAYYHEHCYPIKGD